MQQGELAHRLVKRLYGLTNKRDAAKQISRRVHRMEKAQKSLKRHATRAKLRQGGRATDLPTPSDSNPTDTDDSYFISPSVNKPIKLYNLIQSGQNDPAFKVRYGRIILFIH